MAEFLREGTNPIWGTIAIVAVLTLLGLDIYWLFSESGPILWLARMQAKIFSGKWYPKLTFIVLLLLEIGALLVIKICVEKVGGIRLTAPKK